MKSHHTAQASHSLLGALLLLSLAGAAIFNSFDGLTELLATCKSQWHGFVESLSLMHPHRTVSPN